MTANVKQLTPGGVMRLLERCDRRTNGHVVLSAPMSQVVSVFSLIGAVVFFVIMGSVFTDRSVVGGWGRCEVGQFGSPVGVGYQIR